jgi:glucose-fructose oxidoreductase
MTAYRLHFDEPNLRAISFVTSGKIGEPRLFTSSFSRKVKKGNIRLKEDLGGGTLYDLGVYCINAARYLFRSEPIEVCAFSTMGQEGKFEEVDEMTAAILRFSKGRLATFISSFGAGASDWFEIVGTKGTLRIDNVYDYAMVREWRLTVDEKTKTTKFSASDQFAPELLYFSDCVLSGKDPVPSGREGLADVRVIQALYESAETGRPVSIESEHVEARPGISMKIKRPRVRKPQLIHASEASS